MEILLLIIGLAVGAAVGYLVAHSRNGALQERASMLEKAAREAQQRAQDEIEKTKKELRSDHELDLQRLATQYHETLDSQQQRFDETMERVKAEMKVATADMLQQRQEDWSRASNRDLSQIVNPLRDTITEMRNAMNLNTKEQVSMTSAMRTEMQHMMEQSAAAQKSTEELTRVFKIGNKVQGNWGETVLDELLQSQGLVPGRHYDLQAQVKDDNGGTLKPDVILHLDQERDVVIDAKVSMNAYLDYLNATDEAQRDAALKKHITSIENHVKELVTKDYSRYVASSRMRIDYVIMFVPNSGALWTALHARPDLWRKAMQQGVYIADEQSLYAALRIVDLTWTQISQAQNHEKVYALADEMLNRVGQFWAQYEAMGKALANAQVAYDKGKDKITDGGKSINTTAQQLIDLGAKPNAKNPLPASQSPEQLSL